MVGLTLDDLFRFQDDAANRNLNESPQLRAHLDRVRDSVDLLLIAFGSMRFAEHKQHALRVLGSDALTGVVTSVRVGLWGNLPESAALLRSALETTAILSATVERQAYESVAAEVAKARFKRHTYDKSIEHLADLGQRLDRLRGRLSEIGAHSTGTRLKFASYKFEGQHFDRVGAALDVESATLALSLVPDVCMHLLEMCAKAYRQDKLDFPDSARLDNLRAQVLTAEAERGSKNGDR